MAGREQILGDAPVASIWPHLSYLYVLMARHCHPPEYWNIWELVADTILFIPKRRRTAGIS